MRTKLLPGAAQAVAWLERDIPGQEPEQIRLESFPFTLGRNEACDYQILSSRVSREHAEISRRGGSLIVRDLGSTNGTLVNGQKIAEVELSDGDLLVIADVQFSFRNATGEAVRRTVTQVMDTESPAQAEEEGGAGDLVHAVRRLQETLLHRAARNRFQPIVDLADDRCVGYEALRRPQLAGESAAAQQVVAATDCRLTERLSQLHRLLAAEHIARLNGAALLFVNLQPAEVGADLVPESLAKLKQLAGEKRIVAEIPDSAVVDIPYFRSFLARLNEFEIDIAFDGFAGSPHQVKAQEAFAADYLKLAPALVRGVDKSSPRQQQIGALVEAAAQIGTQLIAVDVHTENEARTCQELGCRLAQGDHLGRPQTIAWPMESVGLSA